ncbi:MAG: discoidin domain-containing protein [Chloroflexaceae bacterium]
MRKQVIHPEGAGQTHDPSAWLDLDQLATAEISSEEGEHPIEAALDPEQIGGWRAATSGSQTIRLRFDQPLALQRIHLAFREEEQPRTQEFVLRWSSDGGRSYQEIVRQQYTFSPPSTSEEVEEYQVNLAGVTILELHLIPDISGGSAHATLAGLYLA